MIEVEHLSKRYGATVAVTDLSFTARPGTVTGFLGPNGAGKSTTMRMIAGLDRPTTGRVLVNGAEYRLAAAPMTELGILLEARAVHTGRSARHHLLALAQTHGLGVKRVQQVLELVGLAGVADRRAGGFSLGMGQRLGIAAALLGDPRVVVLDEPVNGLDPDGVRWVRTLLRSLAEEGRTVFVSSHLMSEMAQTATRLVVVGQGRLLADCTVEEFVERTTSRSVIVRSPEAGRLGALLRAPDVRVGQQGEDVIEVSGMDAEQVGIVAWRAGLPVFELRSVQASLEEAFMAATQGDVQYAAVSA